MRLISVGLAVLTLAMTGCSALSSGSFTNDMLTTAPQSNAELLHPQWGDATVIERSEVQGPYGEKSLYEAHSLEGFLAKHNLDYEVLSGGYKMIRLVDSVKFQTGSAHVSKQSAYWLSTLGQYIASLPEIEIIIDGHTDNTGTEAFNDTLSIQRANAVKQQLVRNHVNQQVIFTRGYGEAEPACTNTTAIGKACNRRAELRFIISTE